MVSTSRVAFGPANRRRTAHGGFPARGDVVPGSGQSMLSEAAAPPLWVSSGPGGRHARQQLQTTRFRVRAPGRALDDGARNLGTRMPGDRADETARRTVDLLPVPGAGQARQRQLQHDRADGPLQPVLRRRVGRPAPPACRQAAQGDRRHHASRAAGPATASSATKTSEIAGRARAPASRRRAGTPSPGCARRSSRRIRKAPGRTRPSAPRWCGSPGARLWRCRAPAAHGT